MARIFQASATSVLSGGSAWTAPSGGLHYSTFSFSPVNITGGIRFEITGQLANGGQVLFAKIFPDGVNDYLTIDVGQFLGSIGISDDSHNTSVPVFYPTNPTFAYNTTCTWGVIFKPDNTLTQYFVRGSASQLSSPTTVTSKLYSSMLSFWNNGVAKIAASDPALGNTVLDISIYNDLTLTTPSFWTQYDQTYEIP